MIALFLVLLLTPTAAWMSPVAPRPNTLTLASASLALEPPTAFVTPNVLKKQKTSNKTTLINHLAPFWQSTWTLLQDELTDLRKLPHDMEVLRTDQHAMRTLVAESNEYRRIRLTAMETSDRKTPHVFTAVLYPRSTNMPIFGVDLLQFSGRPSLAVSDWQPVQVGQAALVDEALASIRNRHPRLQEQMTQRFYDSESMYFSNQLLLGRSDDPETLFRDMQAASLESLQAHVQLTKKAVLQHDNASSLIDLHRAFDQYSAAHDPALPLLGRVFGKDTADKYVHDILFSLSRR